MSFFIFQQSISMNFKVFLLIFVLPIFTDISVKSKYRYICNYRYFVPFSQPTPIWIQGEKKEGKTIIFIEFGSNSNIY